MLTLILYLFINNHSILFLVLFYSFLDYELYFLTFTVRNLKFEIFNLEIRSSGTLESWNPGNVLA